MQRTRTLNHLPLLAITLACGVLLTACGGDSADAPKGSTSDIDASTGSSGSLDTMTEPDTAATFDSGADPACPGGAGCLCVANDDCDAVMCMEGPGGKRCAQSCVDTCDQGFTCAQVPKGSDVVLVCVSSWSRLCSPCEETKDCNHAGVINARCVDAGAAGSYCGSGCVSDDDCPDTHACKNAKDVDGNTGKQCLPVDSAGKLTTCTCSENAVNLALKTACSKSVAEGGKELVCLGEAQCKKAGQPALCQAAAPTTETCDGLDNDCDGDTDEASCDDNNVCTKDSCEAGKGDKGCGHAPVKDGATCDADGSVCTVGDACQSGTCEAGPAKNCDDKNSCTKDSCDLATGCTQIADNGVPCDDENPCTVGDVCTATQCKGGKAKVCTSTEFCVVAKCDMTKDGACGFENRKSGTTCDDGNACTSNDGCEDGSCLGAKTKCDDTNPCTDDSCDAKKGCVYKANVAPCDDGDPCTLLDKCIGALCKAGAAKGCDDKESCTVDSCDKSTGKCVFNGTPMAGAVCDADGSVCTVGDACKAGKCAAGSAKKCDDSNACTKDGCDTMKGCVHADVTTPCDDGDACTPVDTCKTGKCVPGKSVCLCKSDGDCVDDGDMCNGVPKCVQQGAATVCQIDLASAVTCDTSSDTACKKATCAPKSGKCGVKLAGDGASCEDGSYCTKSDACKSGSCASGTVVACNDGNVCTADTCDPTKGCVFKVVDGQPCDADGSVCTQGDVCVGSSCAPGKKLQCEDGTACAKISCDPTKGCVTTPLKGNCDDGDPCTFGDVCSNGSCSSGLNKCACKQDGDCKDDGDLCNGVAMCDTSAAPYVCKVKPGSVVSCDTASDGLCKKTACVSGTGKCATTLAAVGVSCVDGDACTSGDACVAGACAAGKKLACDDGNVCTADSCDKVKGCVFKVVAGGAHACYSGPAKTVGVGLCLAGKRACDSSGQLGACQGAVLPAKIEVCDGKDDDCDGETDEICKATGVTLSQAPLVVRGGGGGKVLDAAMQTGPSGDAKGAKTTMRWSLEALWRLWWK